MALSTDGIFRDGSALEACGRPAATRQRRRKAKTD